MRDRERGRNKWTERGRNKWTERETDSQKKNRETDGPQTVRVTS